MDQRLDQRAVEVNWQNLALFLANAEANPGSEAAASQLTVVLNWFEELRRLVPTN